jgi:phage shock protein A
MQRAVQKLREEKQETIADVEAAKQSDQINSVLAGIAHDTTDQDLIAVRQARQRAKARATISAELVGNDAKMAEDEYIQYAANTENADAFAKLVGLDEDKPTEEPTLNPAKLPE